MEINIIIKQNNEIILQKEVSHELEYFNVSRLRNITTMVFSIHDVFRRLIKNHWENHQLMKIIVGSLEAQEKKSKFFTESYTSITENKRTWNSANFFSTEKPTSANLDFLLQG
jgi:hypothetical protein